MDTRASMKLIVLRILTRLSGVFLIRRRFIEAITILNVVYAAMLIAGISVMFTGLC